MMRRTAWGATWRGEGANTNPMASAPRPTASRASASEVMPQIFTSTVSPLCPGLRRAYRAHRPVPARSPTRCPVRARTAARRSGARMSDSPTSTAW